MGQSHAKSYINIIFSTKNRNPLINVVSDYIANQHEHRSKKAFKEEYLAFLKYSVEYDERYLRD